MVQLLARSSWLRVLQIVIGSLAIILSIMIIVSSFNETPIAALTAIILFAVVLFIVGIERIASGIGTEFLSRRSRMINIGIGAVVLFFAIITIAFPENSINFLILVVGLALLFNGIIRVIDGLRKSYEHSSQRFFRLAVGGICIVIAGFVLASEQVGLIVVTVVMVVALVIQGAEILYTGIKGEKARLLGKSSMGFR